jgi:hypothetical protein
MKALRLSVAIGLILAVSSSAWAISLLQPYQGPVTMKFRNWDVYTHYNVADGTYVGQDTLNSLPQTPPRGGQPGEDFWGVMVLTDIYGKNNELLWSAAIPGTPQITGLFWNGSDNYLKQTTGVGGAVQNIHGTGLHMAFYEDPSNNFTNADDTVAGKTGTARRTAAETFLAATDGNLLWTANSTPGFDSNFPLDEYFSTYSPSNDQFGATNAFGGLLADLGAVPGVGTGPGNGLFDGANTPGADWRMVFTAKPDPLGEFDLISDDPIDAKIIPEPLTVLGVIMGISSLVTYVRRRP